MSRAAVRALLLALPALLATCIPRVRAVRFRQLPQSDDHQAHAKTSGPYFAVDWDGDGADAITIDASESHTHYFDHGPPPVSGSIVKYEWFSTHSGTKLLQSASPYLSANFFLGITILKLVVTDSTGDSAEAYTYVSVRQPLQDENQSPTVTGIKPPRGPAYGGTIVSVYGTGFYNNPVVRFGEQTIKPETISDTELRFRAPEVGSPRVVRLHVSNGFGSSLQFVEFKYFQSAGNPVQFRESVVKSSDGQVFAIPEITSIKLGPDGAFYAGSLNGFVHVLKIDRELVVQSSCRSPNAGRGRSILGLAFNPNEFSPFKLYLTTSTLYWESKTTGDSWDNGKVEVWGHKREGECVSFSYTLISGLPVSPKDHAVNGLLFDSDGALMVAVGGSTNAGVHFNDSTGGIPESPLSGAILRFDMFNSSFDGNIKYSGRDDPGTATVKAGTVEVFASGLRNVFGLTIHSNGEVYAMDNGPNNGFGVEATGCGSAGNNVWFSDKMLHIRRGGFYGHPNWNRGRFDKRQCAYVPGDTPSKGSAYTAPMTTVASSTSGIVEYTANTFGAQLRGQLLLSKLSWVGDGSLTTAKLDDSGMRMIGEVGQLHGDSGLSVEMGPYGEILMPKIKKARILGLVPVEEKANQLYVMAVVPRRGPALGGNMVLVTGNGFEAGVQIFFGRLECADYQDLAEDGTSILCKVPRFASGERTVSVVARYENIQSKASEQGEYQYMNW